MTEVLAPSPQELDPQRSTCPILIFGAPRSGTSLLSRLLNAHSRIAIPFETHLFNQWLPRVPQYGDLSQRQVQRLLVEDITRFGVVRDWRPVPTTDAVMAHVHGPGFGAVARGFMDWAAASANKPRWGEKTPHHTLLHHQVLNAWDNALVIAIQRDPRDVAQSWKSARFGGTHVLPFAQAWTRYIRAARQVKDKLGPGRVFELRYETLVRAPEETLTELMAFLGEEFEPQQLAFHRANERWHTDVRNRKNLQSPISDRSVGLWRKELSRHEVGLIETAAGDEMRRLGYPLSDPGLQTSGADLALAQWVAVPFRRVTGLARNTRGLVYLGRDLAWRLRDYGGRSLTQIGKDAEPDK